jgi:hypothetical protein
LFFVGETPVFAEPGEFKVCAVVRCPPGEYLSAPVAVSVKPSSPEKLAFLSRDKLGMLSEQLLSGPSTSAFEFPLTDVKALPDSLLRRQLLMDHVLPDLTSTAIWLRDDLERAKAGARPAGP